MVYKWLENKIKDKCMKEGISSKTKISSKPKPGKTYLEITGKLVKIM